MRPDRFTAVADERIEIMRHVVLERVAYAIRAAAGIGICIGCRKTQPPSLVLQHRLEAQHPARAVEETAVVQQESSLS